MAKTWKSCDEKDAKSKGAAKACAGMLFITLKILIMMTHAAKHFSCLNVLWPEKMFYGLRKMFYGLRKMFYVLRKMFYVLGHYYQNVINSISAQALAVLFWFQIFFIKNIYPLTLHECFIVHIENHIDKINIVNKAYKNNYPWTLWMFYCQINRIDNKIS